nr:hypothetical protein [uncultured bacterium]
MLEASFVFYLEASIPIPNGGALTADDFVQKPAPRGPVIRQGYPDKSLQHQPHQLRPTGDPAPANRDQKSPRHKYHRAVWPAVLN